MTAELEPRPATPAQPLSLSRIVSYLASRHIEYGSITGDQYDRETCGPHFLAFVLEETEARMGDGYQSIDPVRAQKMLHLHNGIRSAKRDSYKEFQKSEEKRAAAKALEYPEIAVAFDLSGFLEGVESDCVPIARDVIVALSRAAQTQENGEDAANIHGL